MNSYKEQTIICSGSDVQNTYPIHSTNVSLLSSELSSVKVTDKQASNKIKVNPAVSFPWEHRFYFGRLVAYHRCGYIMAYAIKGNSGSMVRVFNMKTASKCLLKNFNGRIVDLAFANISEATLAIVDETGAIRIEQIDAVGSASSNGGWTGDPGTMENRTILNVTSLTSLPVGGDTERGNDWLHHRVTWCPWIPEDVDKESSNDLSTEGHMLAASHGKMAELYHVDIIRDAIGDRVDRAFSRQELTKTGGYFYVSEHKKSITDLALSPDGCALATASLDGHMHFYNLDSEAEEPMRQVFDWQPHDGNPVFSLLFLDDRRPGSFCPLWYSVITGGEYNREIKLWRCDQWVCLQTIRFNASRNDVMLPALIVSLDVSSRFLVLSDIKRTVLYVVEIGSSQSEDSKVARTQMLSVSEFIQTSPCISFTVTSACRSKKTLTDEEIDRPGLLVGETDNDPELLSEGSIISIRMTTIHPTNLQNIILSYPVPGSSSVSYDLSNDSEFTGGFQDGLSDVSSSTYRDTNGASGITFVGNDVASSTLTQVSNMLTPTSSHDHPPKSAQAGSVKTPLSTGGADVRSSGGSPTSSLRRSLPLATRRDQADLDPELAILADINSTVSTPRSQMPSEVPAVVTGNGSGDAGRSAGEDWPPAPYLRSSRPEERTSPEDEEEDMEDEEGSCTATGGEEDTAAEEDKSGGSTADDEADDDQTVGFRTLGATAGSFNGPATASGGSGGRDRTAAAELHLTEVVSNSSSAVNKALLDQLTSQGRLMEALLLESVALRNQLSSLSSWSEAAQIRLDSLLREKDAHRSRRGLDEENAGALRSLVEDRLTSEFCKLKGSLDERMQSMSLDLEKSLVRKVTGGVQSTVKDVLQSTIQAEVKRSFSSSMQKITDPIRSEITRQVQEKLAATEDVLKDHVTKVVTDKSFVDTVSQRVSAAIQAPLTQAYREALQTHSIPAINSAVGKLFTDMNKTCHTGLQQMTSKVEGRLDSGMTKLADSQMTSLTNWQAKVANDRHRQLDQQTRSLTGIEERLDALATSVKEDQQTRMMNASRGALGGAETPLLPAQPSDLELRRGHVFRHLSAGRVGQAFEEALTSTHLPLLLELCHSVDPKDLFNKKPCPLAQHVLLSLLQQLTRELSDNTALKLSYLEEALWIVEPSDASVSDYCPKILNNVHRKVEAFIQNNPEVNPSLGSSLKMVLKIISKIK